MLVKHKLIKDNFGHWHVVEIVLPNSKRYTGAADNFIDAIQSALRLADLF